MCLAGKGTTTVCAVPIDPLGGRMYNRFPSPDHASGPFNENAEKRIGALLLIGTANVGTCALLELAVTFEHVSGSQQCPGCGLGARSR